MSDSTHPRSAVQTALVALFFASGATSLVYEVLWARQLHLVFGVGQIAVSAVLAGFMAGLALGALLAGRVGHRVRRPLVAYAALEGAIAVYALLFPLLLDVLSEVSAVAGHGLASRPGVLGGVEFLLALLLLLPPTLCMGATLPLLSRFAVESQEGAGLRVGVLYGANTLGAVVGTAGAGFLLLPHLGLSLTNAAMVASNLAIAVVAVGLARVTPPLEYPTETGPSNPTWPIRAQGSLLTVAALTGLTALLYEVAWFRLLLLILGGSTYAFSIMLVAFLMGLGLGAPLGGQTASRAIRAGGLDRVWAGIAWIQAGVALLALAALWVYAELPYAFVRLFDLVESHPVLMWPGQTILAVAIMLPPALLMGMTFPWLVQAAVDRPETAHRPVARLYGANTVGAVLGASLGGLWLLPALSMRGSVLLAAGLNLLVALLARAVAVRPWTRRWWVWSLPTTATVLLVAAVAPPWQPLLMTAGMYVNVAQLDPEDRSREAVRHFTAERNELLFYEEGRNSVVTVGRELGSDNVWMANNGKVDASSQADMPTQLLVGHLPLLLEPQARRVLVIGYASGVSVGAVTRHRGPDHIDVVELEPAVIEASRAFDDMNGRPLEDPRVRLHIDDGRHFVAMASDESYDVVASEPPNPWLSGVSNLFTQEFYELGKRKLRPGGVWGQWVHTYGMGQRDLLSLLATFATVYEHVILARVDAFDLILLGSDAPLELHAARLRDLLEAQPAVAIDLRRAGIDSSVDLVSLVLLTRPTIVSISEGVGLNTDDNMRIEHSAPLHLYQATSVENARALESHAEIPIDAVEGLEEVLELSFAYAQRDLQLRRALAVMRLARDEHPDDRRVRALQTLLRTSHGLDPVSGN